ncbi:MAG: hypothetical protein ACLTR8_02110 [Oscillospiraceae bacterium]
MLRSFKKWVSPVGKSISTDGYTLTVDAYVYDSTTQCGFITMLLTHDAPIELSPGRNNLLGNVPVNFNQYGYAYLIPEKDDGHPAGVYLLFPGGYAKWNESAGILPGL